MLDTERPTYVDAETGIKYHIGDDGTFVGAAQKAPSLQRLRDLVLRDRAEDAEKAAKVERRTRLASIVDSDTAYIVPDRRTAHDTGLTEGEPVRVKVRAKAARGGWNVTVVDSGKKLSGMEVYDLDEDQLRRIAELDRDIVAAERRVEAHEAKLRDPLRDPATVVERTGPTSWTITTQYYIDADGKRDSYRGYGGQRETEVVAVHEVQLDPVTGLFDAEGDTADSMFALKELVAAADNLDRGLPGTVAIGSFKLREYDGPLTGFFTGTDSPFGRIIVDPSYDRPAHAAAEQALSELVSDRRAILNVAFVGEPTEVDS